MARKIVGTISIITLITTLILVVVSLYCLVNATDIFFYIFLAALILGCISFVLLGITDNLPKDYDDDNFFGW